MFCRDVEGRLLLDVFWGLACTAQAGLWGDEPDGGIASEYVSIVWRGGNGDGHCCVVSCRVSNRRIVYKSHAQLVWNKIALHLI